MSFKDRYIASHARINVHVAAQNDFPATLGSATGVLAAPSGQAGYVVAQVQVPSGLTEMEVLCVDVPRRAGLKVRVKKEYGVWTAYRADPAYVADFYGGNPSGVTAGELGYFGANALVLDARQVSALRVYPTATPSLSVTVGEYLVRYGDTWVACAGGTLDLTAKVPSTALMQKIVIVGVDGSAGTLTTVDGADTYRFTAGSDAQPFTITDIALMLNSATVPRDFIPGTAVRLYAGQTAVQKWDIFLDVKALAGQPRHWPVSTADVTTPPTDAELDAIYGTPAYVGEGFHALVNDNGAGTDEYLVWSDGTNWFYATGTKAT